MSDVSTNTLPDTTLALVDNDGVVISLVQQTADGGLEFRHNKEWRTLVDLNTIEGLTFVGVLDNAVDLYDKYEVDGNLVPIKFYGLSPDGPYWTDITAIDDDEYVEFEDGESDTEAADDENDENAEPEALAASIVLNSASDLDIAIAAAVMNPDLRWFVERRIAALGLEAALPWQKG